MKKIALLLFVLVTGSASAGADDQEIQALRQQVEDLTERVTKLERLLAISAEKTQPRQRVELQRLKARERMRKDRDVYNRIQIQEIETLYQVANQKWQTEEGKNSLKDLIKKYNLHFICFINFCISHYNNFIIWNIIFYYRFNHFNY